MTNIWCKDQHYWIFKVTGWTVVWLWFITPFRRVTIHADLWRATDCAQFMIRLGRCLGHQFQMFPLDLPFDDKDSRGFGHMYQASEGLAIACDQFADKYLQSADARMRQILKTYLRGYLEGNAHFIVFSLEAISKRQIDGKHFILLTASPMNRILIDYYSSHCNAIIQGSRVLSAQFFRQLSASIIWYFVALWFWLFPKDVRASTTTRNPAVWIEFSGGERHAFNFWCPYVQKNSFDIFYYLDRSDTPLSPKLKEHLNQSSQNWIDMHEFDVISAARLPLSTISRFLLVFMMGGGAKPLWLRSFEFQMAFWTECYACIFSTFKVKVLMPHQDRSWKQGIQAIALEKSGGIMIGFHWSNMIYDIDNWILLTQHIYFVWGRETHDCLQRQGNSVRHMLPSGIWLQETPGSDLSMLNKLSNNHSFLIAVYDSNVADSLGQTPTHSPTSFARFLRCIISLIKNNRHIGVMLKFKGDTLKHYSDVLPEGESIVSDLESLKTQGRLVELPTSLSPITVSTCCDLAVCYPFNSAGIVTGICGSRSVHWDPIGIRHWLYEDSLQRILFRNLNELEDAVIAASMGDTNIGDFSKWRTHFNHFGDQCGGNRIAWFIERYMDLLNDRTDIWAAADSAALDYLQHFCGNADHAWPRA